MQCPATVDWINIVLEHEAELPDTVGNLEEVN